MCCHRNSGCCSTGLSGHICSVECVCFCRVVDVYYLCYSFLFKNEISTSVLKQSA